MSVMRIHCNRSHLLTAAATAASLVVVVVVDGVAVAVTAAIAVLKFHTNNERAPQ